jgi:Asp-tRNA(Asn)/Glu-tRNA(Gln) amidotransferase A subunit family amidase
MLAQVTSPASARALSTIMQKSFNVLSLLATAVCAINLEWTASDGNRYSAEESTRLPAGCLNLTTNVKGISYFSVGGPIGWPDFNQTVNAADVDLPAGAYVALSLADSLVVARAYQLQEDPAIAFMHGAVPSTSDNTAFTQYLPGRIPVPPALGEGPLAGLRFAVKDIFHVKGMRTSGGSRAYYDTFGPQNYTNAVIETSLAAGAQLVGKTKTIAFALGTPRNGWEIDYQDPWSFRGDGYQTTGGSSSGSSAAIVAYDWLDFTIGSDTGGSVRFPARFAGFYGYKPTHGIYNITGILPAIAEQDTPGHMARSPSIFTRVGRVWLNSTTVAMEQPALPTTIQYWADEAPLTQPAAEALKQAFFANITQALNLSTTSVNLTSSFNTHITNSSTFNEYYWTTYQDQNSAQSWDQIGAPLATAYAAKHGEGAYPPADPSVNLTWADGVNATTRSRYNEAVHRREEYAAWFNTYILPNTTTNTTSNQPICGTIAAHSLHLPPSTVKYDQTPFALVRGVYNGMEASFAGFPEIVVPIGQVRYWSNFTRVEEWQTVTVAFAAPRGCDAVLFGLVDVLEGLGLLREVRTGKTAYKVEME